LRGNDRQREIAGMTGGGKTRILHPRVVEDSTVMNNSRWLHKGFCNVEESQDSAFCLKDYFRLSVAPDRRKNRFPLRALRASVVNHLRAVT
jgi:hypothetical protein